MAKCTNKSTAQIIHAPHCKCGIGIGGWFQTPDRFRQVDFLPPFAFDRYVVFMHVSQATVSGRVWFFLQTFDGKAWFCILALFAMFSFSKLLDNRFAVAAPYRPLPKSHHILRRFGHYLTKSPFPFRMRKAVQSTMMRMMLLSDESVVQNGNRTRQWFLNLILSTSSLFLILAYESSMTASLVQESVDAKFQSAADLLKCHIHPSEVCVLNGGALEIYWNNSIAIDKCHLQNPPHYFSSYEALFDAVAEGRCKYGVVLETAITAAIRERYCGHFVVVGQPIEGGGLSMLLPKGSNLTETMSIATLELQRNQTSSYLTRYFNNLPQCKAEVNTTLSFDKLQMFFAIAFTVGGLICLSMLLVPQPAEKEKRAGRVSFQSEDHRTQVGLRKRVCFSSAHNAQSGMQTTIDDYYSKRNSADEAV
eukprot:TRINITY_DN1994_c0_g1_i5.p1 TRINITY_DN1994_c0_g1~~TRINITY_DN1994_c0_g1_i5.p1  ORF type:complete len:420 (+),score=42.21 TRINITY_DN1994_c0_g1_i5:736-1995(+)